MTFWRPHMASDARFRLRSTLVRAAGFFVLWLVLAGVDPGDLPAAAVAVAGATFVSLRLLPPSGRRLSPLGLTRLALRFPIQAVIAGVDVARRALDPRLPLRPGFVTYSPRLPAGNARDAFCALASLMPGTLPADTNADGTLLVHCLDIGQPAAEQLAVEEALFMRALVDG
ncbi:MAG TPA: Na+/H+ antiporter subunit E [Acetobacteraceae bacterium]|nr:Na+/H+ antiporter subunit E [Acetobacteraceae bacterium]